MALVSSIDDYSNKDTNMKTNQENIEIVVETNNDLQNNVKTMEQRGEQSTVLEIRVEAKTPISNRQRITLLIK